MASRSAHSGRPRLVADGLDRSVGLLARYAGPLAVLPISRTLARFLGASGGVAQDPERPAHPGRCAAHRQTQNCGQAHTHSRSSHGKSHRTSTVSTTYTTTATAIIFASSMYPSASSSDALRRRFLSYGAGAEGC